MSKKQQRPWYSLARLWRTLVVSVLIAAIAAAAWYGVKYFFLDAPTADSIKGVRCDDELVDKAAIAMRDADFPTYTAIATELIGDEEYKKSVDCVYIVSQYYVKTGRVEDARKELDRLERLQNAGQEYNEHLIIEEPASVGELRTAIGETESTLQQGGVDYFSADEDDSIDGGESELTEVDKLAPQ